MKRIFSILSVWFLLFGSGSCLKNSAPNACTDKTVQSEQAQILAFAGANNINYIADPSGIYYEITDPGTGVSPTPTSKIYITYTGKLASSSAVFDSQASAILTGWVLNTLIYGWQLALPLIKKGGSIKVIVPSALGYGCKGFGAVPPNAILYFEITLVDVQ